MRNAASLVDGGPCLLSRYVANVFEELDVPNEYFYDPAEGRLYIFYNATSGTAPPPDFSLVASQVCEIWLHRPARNVYRPTPSPC